jgi:hypothetical protein
VPSQRQRLTRQPPCLRAKAPIFLPNYLHTHPNSLLSYGDKSGCSPAGRALYVYGRRDPATGNNRLAIRRIVDGGVGNVIIGPERFITGQVQAAIPSVAVTESGAVGVFYYTFDGFPAGFPVFTAHLTVTDDLGQTFPLACRRCLECPGAPGHNYFRSRSQSRSPLRRFAGA